MEFVPTGNFSKSLAQLYEERAREKRELNAIFERFTHEFELPTARILKPIDPESDYGKLVIGSRVQLPKGSIITPMFRILMAQAQYRRIEMNELIHERQAQQAGEDTRPKQQSKLGTSHSFSTVCEADIPLPSTTVCGSADSLDQTVVPTIPSIPNGRKVSFFEPTRKITLKKSSSSGSAGEMTGARVPKSFALSPHAPEFVCNAVPPPGELATKLPGGSNDASPTDPAEAKGGARARHRRGGRRKHTTRKSDASAAQAAGALSPPGATMGSGGEGGESSGYGSSGSSGSSEESAAGYNSGDNVLGADPSIAMSDQVTQARVPAALGFDQVPPVGESASPSGAASPKDTGSDTASAIALTDGTGSAKTVSQY
jgi:hypothetical protein